MRRKYRNYLDIPFDSPYHSVGLSRESLKFHSLLLDAMEEKYNKTFIFSHPVVFSRGDRIDAAANATAALHEPGSQYNRYMLVYGTQAQCVKYGIILQEEERGGVGMGRDVVIYADIE